MFYISRGSETMGTVANDLYGNDLGRLMLPRLINVNSHTFPYYAGNVIGNDVRLLPYQIIYIPQFDITHQFFPWKSMAGQLNGIPIETRRNIAMMCQDGIDPNLLIGAWEAANIPKRYRKKSVDDDDDDGKAGGMFWDLAEGAADTYLEPEIESATRFIKAKKNMCKALKLYKEAFNETLLAQAGIKKERQIFAKQILEEPYKEFLSAYDERLPIKARFSETLGGLRRTALSNRKSMTFSLEKIQEIRALKIAGSRVIWAAHGFKVLDLAIEIPDIYEAHKHGVPWAKAAAEAVGQLAVGILAGITFTAGVALCLTPVGWGAILVGAGVSLAGGYVGDHVGKEIVDSMWNNTGELENADFNHWARSVTYI